MSMMMRVVVRREGVRVVRWRRRPAYQSPPPETLRPVGPIKKSTSAQVRQLVRGVRDGLREMRAKDGRRRLRRRALKKLGRAIWWWQRIRWNIMCPAWLLSMAVHELHRYQAWWREVRVRMLLRNCRKKEWCLDW